MKRANNSRGFALIVTLMVSLVIVMMLGATLALNPGRLARAGNTGDQALAESAIEAGIEYARTRLQENPLWKAEGPFEIDTTNLYIKEHRGMVLGLLRPSASEPYSMFRIRFNYYNSSASAAALDDNMDDPDAEYKFDMREVSVNNLEGALRFVPQPNSSNVVDDPSVGLFQLPPGTVCIGVEGYGGNGLNRIDKDNFDPPPGSRAYSRRTAVVVLAIAFADGAPDAAMMGGANLDFTLPSGSGQIEVKAKGEIPRARTKGSVLLNTGGGNSPNYVSSGELRYDKNGSGTEEVSEGTGVNVIDDGSAPFYKLEWDDIHKAEDPILTGDNTKAINIPAGTYVFDDAGDLYYFDKTWAEYKTIAASNPDPSSSGGIPVDSNLSGLRIDSMDSNLAKSNSGKLTFKADVWVRDSDSGLKDFTLVPQRGAQATSSDTSDVTDPSSSKYQKDVQLVLKPSGGGKATLTTSGDTLVAAKIDSDKGGSMVSLGSIRLDASELDKLGNVGVSLFSQRDISISTFDPSDSTYKNMGVDGLFYSWGDFNILTGETGVAEGNWGTIDMKGSVVAYGCTSQGPEIEDPGTFGGTIRIVTKQAKFEWDDKKLGDLLDISKFGDKIVLKRASYIRQ